MSTEHLKAIENLDKDLSRDCYFYYVVPDEMQPEVAEYFGNPVWKSYTELENFKDRIAYRKVMSTSTSTCTTAEEDTPNSTEDETEKEEEHMYPGVTGSPITFKPTCKHCTELSGMCHYMELLCYTVIIVYFVRVLLKLSEW